MDIKILYVGNKLFKKGSNKTSVETLGTFLKKEGYGLKIISDKQNQILRLLHIVYTIIKISYDIKYVLIDTYSTRAFWFAYCAGLSCKLLNLKYITILRGGNLPYRLNKSPGRSKSLFLNSYLNISPSMYLMKAFEEKGYINVEMIPNSIEIKNYTFIERLNIKPKLLWVRAFADIYNPLLALKVLKLLLKQYPEATLSMVGPYKDDSIKTCKQYASKYNLPVKFTGIMPKEEWIKYSENFDLFINTTNVDNTPVSVIEAMALGLPVVSTNVGGIPYLLEHEKDALLVPPENEFDMYSAIQTLINNPEMVQNITKQARHKAEGFDWENVKAEWLKVLK